MPLIWTPQRVAHIVELFDHGASRQDVADALGISMSALITVMVNHRIRRGDSKCLNAGAVATLLGVSRGSVATWIHRFGLVAVNASTTKRPIYAIDELDLFNWLEQPEHFMMYSTDTIEERTLREHLIELRAAHGGWVRVDEVATQNFIKPTAVQRWARRHHVTIVRYGSLWIQRVDAARFTPLSEMPMRRTQQRWTQQDFDTLHTMWTTHRVDAIAAALQRSESQVRAMAVHRGLRRARQASQVQRKPRIAILRTQRRKKIAQLRERAKRQVERIAGHIAA